MEKLHSGAKQCALKSKGHSNTGCSSDCANTWDINSTKSNTRSVPNASQSTKKSMSKSYTECLPKKNFPAGPWFSHLLLFSGHPLPMCCHLDVCIWCAAGGLVPQAVGASLDNSSLSFWFKVILATSVTTCNALECLSATHLCCQCGSASESRTLSWASHS